MPTAGSTVPGGLIVRLRGGTGVRLTAGILDSALSSLATFAVGLAAARLLNPTDLGSYALAFSGFLVASALPTQLVFTPAEVELLRHPADERLGGLRSSLRAGAPVTALSAVVVAAAVLAAIAAVGDGALAGPVVTVAAAAFFSPLQDHVRRLLHAGVASWRAAVVSLVQLVVALGVLGATLLADAPRPWISFGALAAANLASLTAGLVLADIGRRTRHELPSFRQIAMRGRWLLASAAAEMVSGFIAVVVVAAAAGAETAGFAEASRVVSQPLFVLAVGLAAVLGPELTLASRHADARRARSLARLYVVVLVAGAAAYLFVGGIEWAFSPLSDIVPAAYQVNGLVAMMIVAQTATYITLAWRAQALGFRLEREFAVASTVGAAVQLVVITSAGALGARALPLSILAAASVRCVILARMIGAARRSAQPPVSRTRS